MDFRQKYLLFLLIPIFIIACNNSDNVDGTKQTNTENSSPELNTPSLPSIPSMPGSDGFLNKYNEFYSGYWNLGSYYCSGNGFARVGLNGTVAEFLSGGVSSIDLLGEINSAGDFSFPTRTVTWDCQTCGEVRPLETTGHLDWDTKSGFIEFEVACRIAPRGHIILPVTIGLKEGLVQPTPQSELARINAEVLSLVGDNPVCNDSTQCKLLNLKSNDPCQFESILYSTLTVDESQLLELKREYNANEALAGLLNGTSTTICVGHRTTACESGVCVSSR